MATSVKKFLLGFIVSGTILVGFSVWLVSLPKVTVPLTPLETPRSYFEPLIPWQLAQGQMVFVSVADTTDERALGLSHTTALPPDVIKLFMFESDDRWSFWMKDMQYPIDMVWLDVAGTVVHVAENVKPETYPESFRPPVLARYVIETNALQSREWGLVVGANLPMNDLIK